MQLVLHVGLLCIICGAAATATYELLWESKKARQRCVVRGQWCSIGTAFFNSGELTSMIRQLLMPGCLANGPRCLYKADPITRVFGLVLLLQVDVAECPH
jgi:hypothetical protein